MIERVKFLLWKMKSRKVKYSKDYILRGEDGMIKEVHKEARKVIMRDRKIIAFTCRRLSEVVSSRMNGDAYKSEEDIIELASHIIYVAERIQRTRREREDKCRDIHSMYYYGSKHHID